MTKREIERLQSAMYHLAQNEGFEMGMQIIQGLVSAAKRRHPERPRIRYRRGPRVPRPLPLPP